MRTDKPSEDVEGELVGCDSSCSRRHKYAELCLRCGMKWKEHRGHVCSTDSGRGVFRVYNTYQDLRNGGSDGGSVCCPGCYIVVILVTGLVSMFVSLFVLNNFSSLRA
ncbi:hypothetical protein DIPPA_19317 [Diplonema papillatum]|nr:hypothetical protein DIPPA_19317 [Diplonema papillatum]